ncbi:ArsA family ATPase [Anaeroselena agilis]|uniref:ArsA family ATPase n=1 Tax=Anaeroselena agilis TaxID=3063788 RepID=A0ABU3NT26_9FIRM|nr:ArsA family ATPase [Selenomonadales bacterium 4137-cl]
MSRIMFFGGKGGVGKTTSSAAYAFHCADQGLKTLLVSTDPAHSLGDIFEQKIGATIKELNPCLHVLEIDPEQESQKYINDIKDNMKKVVSPVIIEEIEKQLDAAYVSPGAEEAAIFDRLVDIITQYSEEYDKIVFDTAPTGHTLRLLSLPELLGGWLDSLLAKREKALSLKSMMDLGNKNKHEYLLNDPIIGILNRRKTNLERARSILIDQKLLNFVFVMNPERLVIEETKKAVRVLEKYSIPVNSIVVNKLLPDNLQDDFWKQRKALESSYLQEIEQAFAGKNIVKIPLLNADVRAADLARIAPFFAEVG